MINVGRFVLAGALCSLLGADPVLAQGQVGSDGHAGGVGGGRVGADGGTYGRGYGYGGYPDRINASGSYWRGGYWHGGYWGGAFWPAVFYGASFTWFLPVLPSGYATYWYGGVAYYYANDVYYTWDPIYGGYVVTDPPPVSKTAAPLPVDGASAPTSGQLFMYPKNGQTEEQQSTDRRDCQEWAASQAGPGGAQAACRCIGSK